ncbi:fungal-specific transcription factor domain-containing protein [Lipomyces oligophaga]|uniref:fungal-specific transcription factor domain-containing protein n=1 Tax=Lipomyces oligophaga TaxID=45792 RepID=UPI0034CF4B4C
MPAASSYSTHKPSPVRADDLDITPSPSASSAPNHSQTSLAKSLAADKRKLVIACIACRKKKVKCSGDRPACGNCLRLNVPCQYPAVKNRGSRFGYHEMLSKRLEMMERHIRPPSTGNPASPYHISNKLSVLAIPPIGYNYVSGTPSSEDVDPDHMHSHGGNVPNPATSESDSPTSSRDRLLSNHALGEVQMPDFEIIEHLTELYFRYLNNQSYAFLHKPTFLPRLRAGQVNPLLVLAVCAVSARFSRHPDIMTQPRFAAGEPFLLEARKLLSQEFDEPTVETTQALLIMGFSDFCGLNGGRAAIYSGLSMRMAATLGLNKESTDPDLSWIDREIRRKTWWSVLVFDRLAHSGPKRSFLLMEEECQISLPSSDHAFLNNIPVICQDIISSR